jgi:hypothetical protein
VCSPNEWRYIDTVVLYGDPCWTDKSHDAGLARLFEGSAGCDPASAYPAASASGENHGPDTTTYTLNLDPVSGYGWHASGSIRSAAKQLSAAIGCKAKSCAHLDYQSGRAIRYHQPGMRQGSRGRPVAEGGR